MADTPHAPFWVGQRVRVLSNERNRTLRTGMVLQVFWDARGSCYVYRLEMGGERRPELYCDGDLESIAWHDWQEPQAMLDHLRAKGNPSERKLRLFACCCCRRIWNLLPGPRLRRAVEVTEKAADGMAPAIERLVAAHDALARLAEIQGELHSGRANGTTTAAEYAANAVYWAAAHDAVSAGTVAEQSAKALGEQAELAWQATVLVDLFHPHPPVDPSLLAWNDGAVVRLAQGAYDERILPAGTVDNARLLILADALEEAGSTDAGFLGHLRLGQEHWRGCWALDLLTSRK